MKRREGTYTAKLRARAEDQLLVKSGSAAAEGHDTAEESQRLMHELQVHQIELELQNEELQGARAELEAGLARYSDLYDFAPIGYLTLDSSGAIHRVNLTGARLLGRERARLAGMRFGVLVSPDSRPAFNTLLKEVFESQSKRACDLELWPEQSAPIWVHMETVVCDEGGNQCRAVLLDITERKLAERLRQETEGIIRAIYDHLPNPTFVWQHRATGFVLTAFNDAAHAVTNGAMSNLLGRSAAEFPYGIPDLVLDLGRCLEQRVSISRELDFVSPVSQTRGRMVARYGFVPPDLVLLQTEDVTEQRQNEDQLRAAQRMDAIGRLAGGIAHDFNNLLTVVINHADFAMEEVGESAPVRADLIEIRKAAGRAADLTRQLLAFGRKQVLRPQVLDLGKIVGGMEGMLRRLLREDIEISVVLAPGLAKVMADPGQLEQVVMNLAVNARDSMPKGGKLTIETVCVELDEAYASQHADVKPGPYVMLSVTDTGCGMDESTRARIFEPFFTTKRTGKGTGLGLATVYGIVQQSGGSIWVDSEPDKGTTFEVYFPRELSANETAGRTAPLTARVAGSETILAVEDEEAVRNLARRILSDVGYTVLAAANGTEAMLLCERHPGAVHLMLTDMVMPQMNGKDLAERLVKLYPTLRVLFMSGYTDDAIGDHGVLDPGTHFIAKPFNAVDLTHVVREVLDETPPDQPNSGSSLPSPGIR
jgi:PAS domain S-box-containing protein